MKGTVTQTWEFPNLHLYQEMFIEKARTYFTMGFRVVLSHPGKNKIKIEIFNEEKEINQND